MDKGPMRFQATLVSVVGILFCLSALWLTPQQPETKETLSKPVVSSNQTTAVFELDQCDRIDFHTHIEPGAQKRLLEIMNVFKISCAVNLSAMPAGELLKPYLDLENDFGGRLLSFAGLDWRLLGQPNFGQAMAQNLRSAIRQGARGLKIPKALGLMIRVPDGSLLRVDDTRLAPVFAAAGRMQIPVAIHVADPVAFWQPLSPNNERFEELRLNPDWSYSGKQVPSHKELMQQQRNLFAAHPQTKFVAVHIAGNAEDLEWVDQLLTDFPNVSIDVAARIPELGHHPWEIVRAFFVKHQDRILWGSDLGLSSRQIMLGAPLAWREGPEDVYRFYQNTWRYFETADRGFPHPTPIQGNWSIDGLNLPTTILQKLYRDNAIALLGSIKLAAE
jgi:hypothetical protein